MNYKDTMTYQVNYARYMENIKRWLEIYNRKEVKKMKKQVDYKKLPYFETKVVKVRKVRQKKEKYIEHHFLCPICGEQVHHSWRIDLKDPLNPWYQCDRCNNILSEGKREKRSKGNWVNGENLDKIKFPCFCSYMSMSGIRYCELDYITDREYCKKPFYRMKELKQGKVGWEHINTYCNYDLEKLFEFAKPKILKGKIIIFEEEE